MRKFLKKAVAFTVAVMSLLVYYSPVQAAGIFHTAWVRPDDAGAGASATYTFHLINDTAGIIKGIRLTFLSSPTTNGVVIPMTANTPAVTVTNGLEANGWTVDEDAEGAGIYDLTNGAADDNTGDGATIQFNVTNLTNPSLVPLITNAGCVESTVNDTTGVCYVRVQSYAAADNTAWSNETAVDDAFISYSVHSTTQVSARVIPTIEFSVEAVGSAQAVNGESTSAASTASALDFGILQAGYPRILAHDLTVITNAQDGYDVTSRLRTSNLTGTYNDEIDPYRVTINDVADATKDNLAAASWSAPRLWDLSGEGTPESNGPWGSTSGTDTGWFGASSNDTDVFGANVDSQKWAPIQVAANTVMTEDSPDPGTTKVRVGYILGVNVNQKADSYTGTLLYSCTPKY